MGEYNGQGPHLRADGGHGATLDDDPPDTAGDRIWRAVGCGVIILAAIGATALGFAAVGLCRLAFA